MNKHHLWVQHRSQPTSTSCWHTCLQMISVFQPPPLGSLRYQRFLGPDGGMVATDANLSAFAGEFQLRYSPFSVYTPQQLDAHLQSGPLMICGRWYRGRHAYVMTGIEGDGSENGTRVFIDNPAERAPIDFPYGFLTGQYQRGPFGILKH